MVRVHICHLCGEAIPPYGGKGSSSPGYTHWLLCSYKVRKAALEAINKPIDPSKHHAGYGVRFDQAPRLEQPAVS